MPSRFTLKLLIPAVIALALAALSLINIANAEQGVSRRAEVISGVPLELFLPQPTPDGPLPTVLVVHGFSGNRQLMYGFGYTLARNGYAAALIDFAGHGSSLDRMPDGFSDAQYDALAANMDAALAWLREQPFVDADRLAILGHSMGASAVARYGSTHPEVPVTIALSLGNFGAQLPNDPAKPRNLLILVGAAEFAGFISGSTAGLTAAYPEGSAGQTYGDFAAGTARRLVLVPGVEHITILFSSETYREMVTWLDQAFSVARASTIATDARMGWVLLFYVAAAIGFWPLAQILFTTETRRTQREQDQSLRGLRASAVFLPGWRVIVISLLAATLVPILLRLGLVPYQWMPLTVGNYVGMYFLIYGLIVGGYWLVERRGRLAPTTAPIGIVNTSSVSNALKHLLPALALAAYALLTFGFVAHLTWNNFALVGDRAWIGLVLFVCCFAFFLADEVVVARPSRGRRLALYALTKLIVLVSLLTAVAALGAPGFLLLLLPVMVLLFLWHGLYSHWLFGLTGRPWAGALVNAAVFAWTISATFALVQY
jgi:dienelactone hydrolase